MMNKSNNTMIAGDFNICCFSEIDADREQLEDTMEAIGLKQNVQTETHKPGNIIDLVFTNSLIISRLRKYTPQTIYQIMPAYYGPSY